MTITNFTTGRTSNRQTMSLKRFRDLMELDKPTVRHTEFHGALGIEGQFTHFTSNAGRGPVNWAEDAPHDMSAPNAFNFYSRVLLINQFPTPADVHFRLNDFINPLTLQYIPAGTSGPNPGVDGIEVTIQQRPVYTVSEPGPAYTSTSPLAPGRDVGLKARFSGGRKKNLIISVTLDSTIITVLIFGVETFEGREVLRPITVADALELTVTNADYFSLTVRGVTLHERTPIGGSLALLRTLVPRPSETILRGEVAEFEQDFDNSSESLLTQLTNKRR